jgi:multicomponent Na+:H+ antiporter subunit F
MSEFLLGAAVFLLFNLSAGLVRIYRGPTAADRMLAAQLFGTTTVAVLLLLAESLTISALQDVALLFTLLAVPVIVAFVRVPPSAKEQHHDASQ